MGIENFDVAKFMLINRGFNRARLMTSSCVHSQQLDRFLVDVKRVKIDLFQTIFYYMEEQEILNLPNIDH